MSLCYLIIFIIGIVVLNLLCKLIPNPSLPPTSPQSDYCHVTDDVLRKYFSSARSLEGKHIDRFVEELGPYQNMGCFDFGQSVYVWHGEMIYIEVWMNANHFREFKIEEITLI